MAASGSRSAEEREKEIRDHFTNRCSHLYMQLTVCTSQAALYQNEVSGSFRVGRKARGPPRAPLSWCNLNAMKFTLSHRLAFTVACRKRRMHGIRYDYWKLNKTDFFLMLEETASHSEVLACQKKLGVQV